MKHIDPKELLAARAVYPAQLSGFWTTAREAELRALAAIGVSASEAARRLRVSQRTAIDNAVRLGVAFATRHGGDRRSAAFRARNAGEGAS
ncbi:hypothetical protein [Methylopila sp. M107]|uniref:hypothetical protein n=1 Tax=Methylopila sp. M107 TaxID=1101190 RepID=UPI00039BE26A|nr:hypothetical protein [Methylopila sp. M107]